MADAVPSSAWLELPDNRRHELIGVCTIGRKPGNTIVLPDATVSGGHAVVQPDEDGGWTITDLRSTNGVFIRGRRISAPVQLRDGASIRIGPFTLTFRQPDAMAADGTQPMAAPKTVVQTYNGPCWLLLLDLENFTARRQALGEARTAALMRRWTLDARSIVESNGGTLNSQPGDALLFYWREDPTASSAAAVDSSLRGLLALQQRASELGFRIVLHLGNAQLSIGELRTEQLAGPEVDFLFRLEKLAKPLRTRCLLSEPAALALELMAETRDLGAHPVPSFVGKFQLRGLGSPIESSAAAADAVIIAPAAPQPRNILLVARPGAVADGLAGLLANETDLLLVGRAGSGADARRVHRSKRPDLVILDLAMDEADLLTLIRDLSSPDDAVRVLVLAHRPDSPLVERALQSGATGAVLHHEPTNELLLAIRTALNGNVYLSRRIAASTLRALAGSDDGGRRGGPATLSDRELEVFHLVAAGQQNREIAAALGVSVKTVETHKENIKTRLELKSAAELAAVAKQWLDESRSRPPF